MGVVDYISYENGKALIWVNGNSYELDEVVEVADAEYIEAYSMALTLKTALWILPKALSDCLTGHLRFQFLLFHHFHCLRHLRLRLESSHQALSIHSSLSHMRQSSLLTRWSFQDILAQKSLDAALGTSLKFSKHASNRLADRNIELTVDQMERLAEGAQKAGVKGIIYVCDVVTDNIHPGLVRF